MSVCSCFLRDSLTRGSSCSRPINAAPGLNITDDFIYLMDNVCKGNLKVKANKRNSRRRRARSVWKNPRRVATLAGSIFFFFFL